MNSNLIGGVAIVTGAARGIGHHTAVALAAEGMSVVVTDIDAEGVRTVGKEIELAGGRAVAFPGDVSREADVRAVIETAVRLFGRLDVVINNAGIVKVTPLLEISYDDWCRVFEVNVHGPFLMTKEAGRVMRTQDVNEGLGRRGLIINVSSGAAWVGRPFLAHYGATKAALNHLTKSAAVALGDDLISSAVLYPGNVREGMWSWLGAELAVVEGRPQEEVEGERPFQPATETAGVATYIVSTPGMALNGMSVLNPGEPTPL